MWPPRKGKAMTPSPGPRKPSPWKWPIKFCWSSASRTGELTYAKRAPKKRLELWRKYNIVPRGCDIEIVELMHRTHMGVDQDYHNIINQCSRTALSDGWGGSMISTDLQDVIFGCPVPVAGEINLGVLKEDHVNIIIHGHEPVLPEMIYVASQEPEVDRLRPEQGRQGHPAGRHVLLGQRDPHAPRHSHCRQLPAAGAGHHHRRGGRHGGGRAVHHGIPGQRGQVLPYQADHHRPPGPDDRRDHAHPL